ncbi:Sterol-binding domain protein [Thiomonas sp. CB3]|nr:Sterol-binding domain protein [Thiomonas sp. CB3]
MTNPAKPADVLTAMSASAPLRNAKAAIRAVVRRLPVQPPSFVTARLLDHLLLPRLAPGDREALAHRVVDIEVADLGMWVHLRLGERGFAVAPTDDPPVLRVIANASGLWRLVRGRDDADRLFFQRELAFEGDTEFGLLIKNLLDGIGPLWGV